MQSVTEQIQTIGTILAGDELPAALRSETMVVGNRQGGAHPIRIKVIISEDSLPSLSFGSVFIAFRARGVAALPIPRIFAAMAADTSFIPLPLFEASGKIIRMIGLMRREKRSRKPVFSATFIIPHHRHIKAMSENAVVTALPAPSMAAEVKSSVVPLNSEQITDNTIRIPENFIAIILISLKNMISIDNNGILW